ncbi:MAG TPA: Rho termination factor N-terminal domain-containing protein [Acidimicrobiales bacterium]|nr:Rho termination factor N-terminal domain-containing protein [Acidimicrobiales bacterium]
MTPDVRHAVVDRAKAGVRHLPRTAAQTLTRVLRSAGGDRPRRNGGSRADSSGDGTVEALLHQADLAARRAEEAQADAPARAEAAKEAADRARRTAGDAQERLEQARDESARAREEAVRRAEEAAQEAVERARASAVRGEEQDLERLRAELDAQVDVAQRDAADAARRAEEAIAAAAHARDLAARAQQAAEEVASEAAATTGRLGWDRDEAEAEAAGGLERRTKAELLELAADAGVEGRTAMTKAELVEALSAQNGRTP